MPHVLFKASFSEAELLNSKAAARISDREQENLNPEYDSESFPLQEIRFISDYRWNSLLSLSKLHCLLLETYSFMLKALQTYHTEVWIFLFTLSK